MPSWKKVILSGSNATLNNLIATNGVTGSFSGSFQGDGSNLTGVVAAPSVSASYAATASYHRDYVGFGISIDGGGSPITTGVKGSVSVLKGGTIRAWQLIADQPGSIVIDVWKTTYTAYPPTVSDSIAGSEKPTLSSQEKNRDSNLTTWTTNVSAGDTIRFNVDSASTVTWVNLAITLEVG